MKYILYSAASLLHVRNIMKTQSFTKDFKKVSQIFKAEASNPQTIGQINFDSYVKFKLSYGH